MDTRLDVFLRARSVDEVAALAPDLGVLSPEDELRVREVLDARVDEQAVANLLMEPAVLPRDRRVSAILDHLRGDPDSYLALAAVVGADQLRDDELVERQDAEIAAALVDLIDGGAPTPTAQRASVALVRYGRSTPFEELVELLDSGDDVVHHNVLAAIVATVGLDRTAQLLRARANGEDADERLVHDLAAVQQAVRLEDDDAMVADVVLSRLSYIPDRSEFIAEA
jgi:hypothetical protein